MKRGSSVLQPPSDAAKRHTLPANTHSATHTADDARLLSVSDTHATGSSPFPAATSLFSPDVSIKMASDLLIRLSEATQKAQVHPGSRAEAEPQRCEVHRGQQDEPGLALSPDGPGASPEPPSLTHTPEGNAAMDTLASDLLRKLAERQQVSFHGVKVKEEEEPMEVDSVVAADLKRDRPIAKQATKSTSQMANRHHFTVKTEDQGLSRNKMAEQVHPEAKMAEKCLLGLKIEENVSKGGSQPTSCDSVVSGASKFQFRVKMEDHVISGTKMEEHLLSGAKMEEHLLSGTKMEEHLLSGAKMEEHLLSGTKMEEHLLSGTKMEVHLVSGAKMKDQLLLKAKIAERPFSGAKMSNRFLPAVKMEDGFSSGVKKEKQLLFSGTKTENQLLPGAPLVDQVFSRANREEQLFCGAKMENQFTSGAKMADQCLRAVLWQDMSVNLASTLLHQLSERVSNSNNQLMERMTPPIRSSPVVKVNVDPLLSSSLSRSQEPAHETQTILSRDQTTACPYFYRCHVCGFETEGRALFQSHMKEHRQWEHGSFSLHCCMCDHSTNQEAEMRVHADTHVQGNTGVGADMRCPVTLPDATAVSSRAPAVAIATQQENGTSEHRCRICQRSFPGQQELMVHFQGHRQGNQYRCDRCGHLTRTANKLVEHVRVHTGERPFTCDLCPYSAKRRDSLRLHCKVKHGAHVNGNAADSPGDVHTHRSYVHGDNQRSNKHVQWLHTPPSTHTAAPSSSLPPLHPLLSDRAGWRDLSPLIPITTLISLKPRSPSSSPSSSSSSSKHSFLGYLGLTSSL